MFKIEEYIICMSKAYRDIDLNIYVYIGGMYIFWFWNNEIEM